MREVIGHGQQIESFGIRLELGDGSSLTEGGATIGKKRILSFPVAEVKKIEIAILNAKDYSAIYKPEAYLIDEKLSEK